MVMYEKTMNLRHSFMFFVGILSIKYNERESKIKQKTSSREQTTFIIKHITWGKKINYGKICKIL